MYVLLGLLKIIILTPFGIIIPCKIILICITNYKNKINKLRWKVVRVSDPVFLRILSERYFWVLDRFSKKYVHIYIYFLFIFFLKILISWNYILKKKNFFIRIKNLLSTPILTIQSMSRHVTSTFITRKNIWRGEKLSIVNTSKSTKNIS